MRKIYLECKTGEHYKYYRMIDGDDGNFYVEYGRIGYAPQHAEYPMSKWYSTYSSKLSKGYEETEDPNGETYTGCVSVSASKPSDINETLSAIFGL